MAGSNPPVQATKPPKEPCKIIRDRRERAVRQCTSLSLTNLPGGIKQKRDAYVNDAIRTGIAFSGGGIRSATISLGLTEALAVHGRFYAFDMMSTVSGGGYFGSFLRSLFIERPEDEGILKPDRANSDQRRKSRQRLADAVLLSVPDTQYFRGNNEHEFLERNAIIKNPLWWLRENGRYLAPDGFSDYGFAVAYAVRNWLTLAFAIMVALACCFAILQLLLLMAAFAGVEALDGMFALAQGAPPVSPLFFLMEVLLLIGVGIGIGYWTSLGMAPHEHDGKHGTRFFERNWGFLALCLVAAIVAAYAVYLAIGASEKTVRDDGDTIAISHAVIAIFATAAVTSVAVALYSWCFGSERNKTAFEFRRNQTRLLSTYSAIVLALFALCLVDSFALYLRDRLNNDTGAIAATAATSTGVASLFAWLIAKIPGWLEGKASKFVDLLKRNAPLAALIAGLAIAFALAVSADLLVHKIIWVGRAWGPGSGLDLNAFGIFFGVAALFFVLIGSSGQFLNLVAFTPLYSSRLTRSYLGASNAKRQCQTDRIPSDVTKGMKGDDLDVDVYMTADIAAPLHLINVTLNRTVGSKQHPLAIDVENDDPLLMASTAVQTHGQIASYARPRGRIASYESQLTLRDRKGDRMVIGPAGVRAGAEWLGWDSLGNVELPTVGQFCGISGAAVSSGMGRHTSLGMAIALTLANVRLGQWWRHKPRASKILGRFYERFLETYDNLLSELLARYRRDDANWYLSDGGHSENTGLLSLLERGCEFVLVSDNGEDLKYQFADLEILVRSARTDLGIEIEVVPLNEFPSSLKNSKSLFFNTDDHTWRTQAKSKEGEAFALLLKAKFIRSVKADGSIAEDSPPAWIVWLKPSLFKGLPADLMTYAELNADFPQQPTSNQFFGEAQWESYRRLGFEMGRALFGQHDTLEDMLPIIRHKLPNPERPQSA